MPSFAGLISIATCCDHLSSYQIDQSTNPAATPSALLLIFAKKPLRPFS
jgi:hypothetical protein